MPGPKPKKTKLLKGTMRGVRRVKTLGDQTEARVARALTNIAADTYTVSDLVDDVVGQWSDVFDIFSSFSPAGVDDLATAYIITNGPVPAGELVTLPDVVRANQIQWTDLQGPVTVAGGVTTSYRVPAADYVIHDPATDAPPAAATELDSVKVKINVVPAVAGAGVYEGALTLQNTKVLARVVLVRK